MSAKKPSVLLVDDEESIIKSLGGSLEDEGYTLLTAQDGTKAMEIIKTQPVDIVFLDIWLPGMDGLETLKSIKDFDQTIEVITMTGHGTVNTAVQAIKMGAFDFLEKPFSLDTIIDSIKKIQEKRQTSLQYLPYTESKSSSIHEVIIGKSPEVADIRRQIESKSYTDENILIHGESGVGKELVARLIHGASAQKHRPFIKFNCAAYAVEDIEKELFGPQDAGSATIMMKGLLNSVPAGDVYIHAVDLLPVSAQNRCADFLRTYRVKNKSLRIIAASIKDFTEECTQGRMSEKLLSCFSPTVIQLPPLRKRRADIVLLLKFFIRYFCKEYGQKEKSLENEALEVLVNYDWPGNVKELKNIVEKLVVSVPTTSITMSDLPLTVKNALESSVEGYYLRYDSLKEAENAWRRNYLVFHLRKNNQNIRESAQQLHIEEATLRSYIEQYGIVLTHTEKGDKRFQRTLKRSMVLSGRGLHSGIKTGLIISPLPPNSGIIFGNISDGETISAHIDFVESTEYATSLKKGNARASTIEHFLAALHAYRISNLLIKINNEIPIMDGSALDFCKLFEDAGIEDQDAPLDEIIISEQYTVGELALDQKFITIEPADKFCIHYTLNYPNPVGHQEYTFILENDQSFKEEIAPARTFGFLKDIEALGKKGLANGGRLDNFILIDDEKVINTELRFPDEFVRHKILDLMGDSYLLGRPIRGKITANMTGHTQNCSLLRMIRERTQPN